MSTATLDKIEVPDKYDIIPIHTSDRATFKQCRRRWVWSSPAHQNLIPKVTIYGIYFPFWFGTGIHHALQHYYNPVLKQDPEVTFDAWFNLQWNGGEIKESEVDEFADRFPHEQNGKWTIEGLKDVLPDPDYEAFELHHTIGLGMMKFYKEYAERNDDFEVIASEHLFSVPILDPTTGKPLYMYDARQMPEDWEPKEAENAFGPLMIPSPKDGAEDYPYTGVMKQVHARGRMDLIVHGNSTGNYAIIDHKTADTIKDDYFDHTDLDEQCTTYIWAAEVEAQMYDLPYKNIAGIVYQALRKAYPRPPSITTRGLPSLNKATESTTPYLFAETIKELGLTSYFQSDEKMQAYYTYLVEQGEKQFIQRHPVTRNAHQKANAGLRLYMEAMDMLDNPRIYPNPTKDYSCLKCRFRGPCLAVESGWDWEDMIKDGYEKNFDR